MSLDQPRPPMQRLYPGEAGYEDATSRIIAKARARHPRLRVATDYERRTADPARLCSFSGRDGRPVAPVFLLDDEAETSEGDTR